MNDLARGLLTALFERIVPGKDGLYYLIGPIGQSEYDALQLAAGPSDLGSTVPAPTPQPNGNGHGVTSPPLPKVELNAAVLLADPVKEGRLCVDFGTAASKIGWEPEGGHFEPLEIGIEDGEDPFWVRSAVSIDQDGNMVFGQRAMAAGASGLPVLTSFKSKLWGAPAVLDTVALEHGQICFTYRDCIEAYLAFLSHLGASRLSEKGLSAWNPRRYAMPFAYDDERREVRAALGRMLGRAVVLADTLGKELTSGVAAARMRSSLNEVSRITPPSWLLTEPGCIGEPVAAGAFAMDQELNNRTVYMIADVGAGTTDFCILCLKKRADGELEPIQIRNGALSVETAGDAVDNALVEFLIEEQAGEEHRARLRREASGFKERLFAATASKDEQFDFELPGQLLINISRSDFLASAHWQKVVEELRQAQARCFDQADRTYLQNYGEGAIRVVITGGGSALPLQEALADGKSPGQVSVSRIFSADFPLAIRNRFNQILDRLPRLAVALGGSRDLLPADYDRSGAMTSMGVTAPYVAAPFDRTKSGLDGD